MNFEEWWKHQNTLQGYCPRHTAIVIWHAAQEAMRERAADVTFDHSCRTYSELCDCAGYIRKDILALPVE